MIIILYLSLSHSFLSYYSTHIHTPIYFSATSAKAALFQMKSSHLPTHYSLLDSSYPEK